MIGREATERPADHAGLHAGAQESFSGLIRRARRFAHAMAGDEQLGDVLLQRAVLLCAPASASHLAYSLFAQVYQAVLRSAGMSYSRAPAAESGCAEAIGEALHRLTPEDRAVLLLVALECFDYREAGLVLGMTVEEVGLRMREAREELRRGAVVLAAQ